MINWWQDLSWLVVPIRFVIIFGIKQIGQPRFFYSLLWLQSELDSTQSYHYYKLVNGVYASALSCFCVSFLFRVNEKINPVSVSPVAREFSALTSEEGNLHVRKFYHGNKSKIANAFHKPHRLRNGNNGFSFRQIRTKYCWVNCMRESND